MSGARGLISWGLLLGCLTGCGPTTDTTPPAASRPWLLLVTLDTTRADSLGYEGAPVATPNLDALAASSVRFANARTTAPTTLPSHTSMLSGLYPYEHGIHENSRPVAEATPLVQDRLRTLGYETAAFISGFPLSREFGLARGFDHYDDDLGADGVERSARETTASASRFLERRAASAARDPLFLWVHYYDPHEPYEPPPPYDREYADHYLGEIAALDEQVGLLLGSWRAATSTPADPVPQSILVVGDHGEGRGDWGEALHGNLLSRGVMRVPLMVSGTQLQPGVIDEPVSVRRVFDVLLATAESGQPQTQELLEPDSRPVLAEAMKPYLQYGWQPQVMAVKGDLKVVRSGGLEVYDLSADPEERNDLAATIQVDNELRQALRSYPIPDPSAARDELTDESRSRLATLGYVTWEGAASARPNAPRPRDMASLFADLDRGSGLFVAGRYQEAIRTLTQVAERDPDNLMVTLRLASASSLVGDSIAAERWFERARTIAPTSVDVDHYQALHLIRVGRPSEAVPLLEAVLERDPRRPEALRQLARARAEDGRLPEAADLLQRLDGAGSAQSTDLVFLADLLMAMGRTDEAISAFERAERDLAERFDRLLELGVLYLASGRLDEARDVLDRITPDHPNRAMVAFKRAQVSSLLGETDRRERVREAIALADETTRPLIARERLFEGLR